MRIEGMDSLMDKLRSLEHLPDDQIKGAVDYGMKLVQSAAKLNCPVNHGELRNSIMTMAEVTTDGVKGICYTNKAYAPYVEFGTGPTGQQSHSGIAPDMAVSYSQEGWWIPGTKIDEAEAERYHFIKYETDEGEMLYYTNGQPARPFLYPALANNKAKVKKRISGRLRKLFKGQ